MDLLLASFLHPMFRDFLGARVAYVPDAARTMPDAPFAIEERAFLQDSCSELIELPAATTPIDEFRRVLASVDGVYVGSGETFDLLHVLRSTGADIALAEAVRGGLPYAASSAGSIVAGPSIEPNAIMDSPAIAPGLTDYRGLELTPFVIVPHAQGTMGPFTIDVISRTVREYGQKWHLLLLRDGQALHVDDGGSHLV